MRELVIARELVQDLGLQVADFSKYDGAYDTVQATPAELAEHLFRKYKPKPPLTLSQKIFRISREAGAVKRKGVAENNGNEYRPLYAYAQVEDVLSVMQPLLNKYKLIVTGSVVRDPVTHVIRGGIATTELSVEWTLEDTESGESKTWRIPGSGSDENGKGSYRSLTGSRKYFYVIVFNLKFGDEPEEVTTKPSKQSEETASLGNHG